MQPQTEARPARRVHIRQVVRVVIGAIVWIAMMLIAYFLLATVPVLLMLGFWVGLAIWEYLRQPSKPEPIRPDQEDPARALRTGQDLE